jgi:Ca-activated chloride channel family protein
MVRGLEILEAAKRGERELAHVMLLSDGQANVGEKNPEILGARAGEAFRKGISVSTLGVGLDYNEDLMTKLADQGGGRYHFIQGTEAIPKVLADEFAGLVATVAASVQLQLRPGPGIKVARVYGYPSREENGVTTIPVGSLGAQQVREIVVRLEIQLETGPGEAALGVLALSGTDLTDNGKKVAGELALALPKSADEAAIRKSESSEVTVRVAEVESAAQLEAAAKAVDGGDYDKARQVLKDSLVQLEAQQKATPSPKLSKQIEDLKQAESGLDAAKMSAEQEKIYKKEMKVKAYKKAK